MKIIEVFKLSGLIGLILTVAVGCATAPTEQPVEQPAVTQQDAVDAINAARAAMNQAAAEGYLWRDTGKILEEAEAAYKAGDYAKAVELANRARRQAENALAQGRAQARETKADDSYTVRRGDSLWNISARDSIYGNPYKWPLIYKANAGKIKDADLIYPGQVFTINRNASESESAAAIRHARTRGAWSIGVVEDSDRAYLRAN